MAANQCIYHMHQENKTDICIESNIRKGSGRETLNERASKRMEEKRCQNQRSYANIPENI